MWRETVNIDRNIVNHLELAMTTGSWIIHILTVIWGS